MTYFRHVPASDPSHRVPYLLAHEYCFCCTVRRLALVLSDHGRHRVDLSASSLCRQACGLVPMADQYTWIEVTLCVSAGLEHDVLLRFAYRRYQRELTYLGMEVNFAYGCWCQTGGPHSRINSRTTVRSRRYPGVTGCTTHICGPLY